MRTSADQSLNGCPNALGILHDLVRAEPNDAPSPTFHHRRTPRIRFDLVSVMVAVDLNDQPFRWASEVGEVRANGMLAAELNAFHAVRTDQFPAEALCAARIAPEAACPL